MKEKAKFMLLVTEEQKEKLIKKSHKNMSSVPSIIRQIMDKYKDSEKTFNGYYPTARLQVGCYVDKDLYDLYKNKYGKNLQGVLRTLLEIEL